MKKLLLLAGLLLAAEVTGQAWIQRTGFGGTGRHRASGFAIGNRGYIGLGHVNGNSINVSYKDWWEYDPATDSWSQIADFPVVNYGAVAFATATRGYAGGGAALNGEFYEYNPQANTWSPIASCPGTPDDQGCFAVNNKGYVLDGASLYEYDPATNAWTAKQAAPVTFSAWCAGFSAGTSGYIKNGYSLYEYKPLQDQWIQRASFPGVNTNGGCAFVRGGRAYIISGYVGALTNVTSEVWEYNPGNNTWTRMNDFPGTSRRFAVAFTINDRGYVGTGTNGINFNDFWEMNDNVSVNELAAAVEVNVYPNPATEFVTFNIPEFSAMPGALVALYTVRGELAGTYPFDGTSCVIAREGKAAGVYFYRVMHNGTSAACGKLIFN